jgi:hypothetical protein
MLREIPEIEQYESEGFRRWFTCAEMDLFVWYDENSRISKFQISANELSSEYLIDWSYEDGLKLGIVDCGKELSLKHKSSSIVLSDNTFNKKILLKYLHYAKRINKEITYFIFKKLFALR